MLVQLSILALCHTVLAMPGKPVYDVEDLARVQMLFEDFIAQYHRTYDDDEKMERLQYFKQSLAKINDLNERNPYAMFDINDFSDWSPEEHKALSGYRDGEQSAKCAIINELQSSKAPDAFDWKDEGVVTPVKNQMYCGSCWAFSCSGGVEGAYAIKYKKLLYLSEQQMVDCDTRNYGCGGGLMTVAYEGLMEQGGLETEDDYPYISLTDVCSFNRSKISVKVIGCHQYQTENNADAPLKEILFQNGPLTIGLDAHDMQYYKNGIITSCYYGAPDHAVLITGYGSDNNIDFWNIKNSWGESFGEKGYVRVKRGVSCMGIGNYTSSPVVG